MTETAPIIRLACGKATVAELHSPYLLKSWKKLSASAWDCPVKIRRTVPRFLTRNHSKTVCIVSPVLPFPLPPCLFPLFLRFPILPFFLLLQLIPC